MDSEFRSVYSRFPPISNALHIRSVSAVAVWLLGG